jgi:transcriptional antiterminator NusG
VPTEEVVEMREGQKRKSERKFFPGYVLVQMEMDEETWHLVKEVPKVLGFIGGTPTSRRRSPMQRRTQILHRVEEGVDKPRPKVHLRAGRSGARGRWAVQRFQRRGRAGQLREEPLQVAVQILGRSTPVELDFGQVEKAEIGFSTRLGEGPSMGGTGEPLMQGRLYPGKESLMAKKVDWLRQAAGSCRQGESQSAHRSRPRSAGRQHHGVLQGSSTRRRRSWRRVCRCPW